MVTHLRPSYSASFEEARQTGEMRGVYWAGEASFRSVRSLLKVLEFQFGCVMACGARKSGHRHPELVLRWVGQGMPEFLCPEQAACSLVFLHVHAARHSPLRWTAPVQALPWMIGHTRPGQQSGCQDCSESGVGQSLRVQSKKDASKGGRWEEVG